MKATLEPKGLQTTMEVDVPGFSRQLRLGQDTLGGCYFGISFDLYHSKLRDNTYISILLDGRLSALEAAMTFYVPVNPWLFTLATFSQHARQFRQEEGMRDIIREHIPHLLPFLVSPIAQCPGLEVIDLGDKEGLGYRYSEQSLRGYIDERTQRLVRDGHVTTEAEAIGLLSLLLGTSLSHQLGLNNRLNSSPPPVPEPHPKRPSKTAQKKKSQAKPSYGPIDILLGKSKTSVYLELQMRPPPVVPLVVPALLQPVPQDDPAWDVLVHPDLLPKPQLPLQGLVR